MRFVVLGSGTSFGVPQIGCDCRVCTSSDPRDRRTRVAALVEADDGTRLLIDTPPELRLQLLAAGIDAVDAVLYTHDHADHVHGIDDLRAVSLKKGRVPLYGELGTLERIVRRFGYIFENGATVPGIFKPDLTTVAVQPGRQVSVCGIPILPLQLFHGSTSVLGYRIGSLAYMTDVKTVPDETLDLVKGVEVLILSALLDRPHPTHLSIDEAVVLAQEIGAVRTYMTHLTHLHTHVELSERLPDGIEPAHDGLEFEL
ncbi:MAG: MBL fold metallo-hydrolase [Gemmatimonadales bacterium]